MHCPQLQSPPLPARPPWCPPIGPTTTIRLQRLETVSGLHTDVGPAISDSTQGPGYVTIGAHIPPDVALEDWTYSILVTGSGVAGDHAGGAAVYGDL